ncbi:CRADD protein, partial [Eudromia elegans]|nr:CRADD protein [Eudromia elegans]
AEAERATLLAVQLALSQEQFEAFKFLLEERIPRSRLERAGRAELCSLLLQHCPGRALQQSAAVLRRLGRLDLVERFQLPGAHQGTGNDPGGTMGAAAPGKDAPAGDSVGCTLPAAPASPCVPERLLTERELMQVAQLLGREWQEVAVGCLGLEKRRLEQIREDNPGHAVLQAFEGLREWRRRQRHRATASVLHACLAAASVDPELLALLQSLRTD